MKIHEKILFGILITGVIIFFILFTRASTTSVSNEIAILDATLKRVESEQHDLTDKIAGFEKKFLGLGESISTVGQSVHEIGGSVQALGGRVQEVKTGLQSIRSTVSGLNAELQNFGTRLPEIEKLVYDSGTGIQRAQRLVSEIEKDLPK